MRTSNDDYTQAHTRRPKEIGRVTTCCYTHTCVQIAKLIFSYGISSCNPSLFQDHQNFQTSIASLDFFQVVAAAATRPSTRTAALPSERSITRPASSAPSAGRGSRESSSRRTGSPTAPRTIRRRWTLAPSADSQSRETRWCQTTSRSIPSA